MTQTPTIHKIDTATKTVVMPFLTRTSLQEVSVPEEKARNAESIVMYRVTTGDPAVKANVTMAIYDNPSANRGMGEMTVSAKFETVYRLVDDTSGAVVVEGPAAAKITLVMPGRTPNPDSDQTLALILNAVSLFFHDVDVSNIPEQDVVDSLAFSVATVNQ